MSNPSLAAIKIQRRWRKYNAYQKDKLEDTHIWAAFGSVVFMQALSILMSACCL